MRKNFRTFDSKISFFAFADIITAVSGMLVFIALLLATDLGKPTQRAAQAVLDRQLQNTLTEQSTADSEIDRLQQLLAAAETAPSAEKLQADLATLRRQLAQVQARQAALDDQMTSNQAAIAARDRALGLTDLKASVDKINRELQSIRDQDNRARGEMQKLEQQVAHAESQLLKLRQQNGQLWLIPDKSVTTKEPILVTVAGSGIDIERFDRPDLGRTANSINAADVFSAYLKQSKKSDQYLVFLIKPSGIALFQDLVQSARDLGFSVGYDALEEDQHVHFTTPPASVDEAAAAASAPPAATASANAATAPSAPASSHGADPSKPGASAASASATTKHPPPPPPPSKSWWQRFLEWIGLA